VTVQGVNQSLAQSFGLPKPQGALVSSVEDGGPAARGGVMPGDVILEWNGKPVAESSTLPALVADTAPGQQATVKVWRNGAERTLQVAVGRMPDETSQVASADAPQANSGKLGLVVRPLTSEERQELHASGGLLVEQAAGAAAAAGVQDGDVILSVNNERVKSAAQLRAIIEKAGKHVALLVQREDTKVFVPIDLG